MVEVVEGHGWSKTQTSQGHVEVLVEDDVGVVVVYATKRGPCTMSWFVLMEGFGTMTFGEMVTGLAS